MLHSISELEALLGHGRRLYLRYSQGPDDDARTGSIDTESGLVLPGISTNPLDPEPWWTRPTSDWLARQLSQYLHLQQRNSDRIAWVLSGDVVARGPDCEPLIAHPEFIARLSDELLDEAWNLYHERFHAGNGPE
jgi:hypothetical protein